MFLNLHGHLNNLIKGVIQQEVQVIQWRRIFVLESIKKSFLYHPKLDCSTLKYFPEISTLFSDWKMLIYDFKQLGSWNTLFENENIVYGLASEVFSYS